MSWFKVDDCFHSHPKVLQAGNEALGLWVRCGAYCTQHLTDGFIPQQVVLLYGSVALAEVLVQVGLWVSVDGGWHMHDFLIYNRARSQVLSEREDAQERQRRSRERRKAVELGEQVQTVNGHDVSHSVTANDGHSVTYASVTAPRPDPTNTTVSNLRKPTDTDNDFTEFWKHYPRKRQKVDAQKAWKQLRAKHIPAERIIAGSRGYAAHCKQRNVDEQFVKYPGAWLRAGGFDDYQPEPDPVIDRDPTEYLRELWHEANAQAVAVILRIPFIDRPQPPSDPTPRDKWLRDSRRSWITDHSEAALQALTPPHLSKALSNGSGHQQTAAAT